MSQTEGEADCCTESRIDQITAAATEAASRVKRAEGAPPLIQQIITQCEAAMVRREKAVLNEILEVLKASSTPCEAAHCSNAEHILARRIRDAVKAKIGELP